MLKSGWVKKNKSLTLIQGVFLFGVCLQVGGTVALGQQRVRTVLHPENLPGILRRMANVPEGDIPLNNDCRRPLVQPALHSRAYLPRLLRFLPQAQRTGAWAHVAWINTGRDVMCPFAITEMPGGDVRARWDAHLFRENGFRENLQLINSELGLDTDLNAGELRIVENKCTERFTGVASIDFRVDSQVPGALGIIFNSADAPGLTVPATRCQQILRVEGGASDAVRARPRAPSGRTVFRNADQEGLERRKTDGEDPTPVGADE